MMFKINNGQWERLAKISSLTKMSYNAMVFWNVKKCSFCPSKIDHAAKMPRSTAKFVLTFLL